MISYLDGNPYKIRYRTFNTKTKRYVKNRVVLADGTIKTTGIIAELDSGITDLFMMDIYLNDFIQGDTDDYPFLVQFEEGQFVTIEQDGGTDVTEPLNELAADRYVVGNVHENPELLEEDK